MVATMVEAENAWAIAVGDAIRRELGDRTQRWLSTTASLDAATVSRIISGQQLPSLNQLDAIARAFGVTRRYLLRRTGYVESAGDIDLDTLPGWARHAIEALLEQVERERSGSGGEGVVGNDGHGFEGAL